VSQARRQSMPEIFRYTWGQFGRLGQGPRPPLQVAPPPRGVRDGRGAALRSARPGRVERPHASALDVERGQRPLPRPPVGRGAVARARLCPARHPQDDGRRHVPAEGPHGSPRGGGHPAPAARDGAGVRRFRAHDRPGRAGDAREGGAFRHRRPLRVRAAGTGRAAGPAGARHAAHAAREPDGEAFALAPGRRGHRHRPPGPDDVRGRAGPGPGHRRGQRANRRRSPPHPGNEEGPRRGRRAARVHPYAGRARPGRRPRAVEALDRHAQGWPAARGRREAPRSTQGHPAARRPGVRQESRRQGDCGRLGAAAARPGRGQAARPVHRRIRAQPARRPAPRRAHGAVRALDRRDREGLHVLALLGVRRRRLQAIDRNAAGLDAGARVARLSRRDRQLRPGAAPGDDAQGPRRRSLLRGPARRGRPLGDLPSSPDAAGRRRRPLRSRRAREVVYDAVKAPGAKAPPAAAPASDGTEDDEAVSTRRR
jgi:hypothetical protein